MILQNPITGSMSIKVSFIMITPLFYKAEALFFCYSWTKCFVPLYKPLADKPKTSPIIIPSLRGISIYKIPTSTPIKTAITGAYFTGNPSLLNISTNPMISGMNTASVISILIHSFLLVLLIKTRSNGYCHCSVISSLLHS